MRRRSSTFGVDVAASGLGGTTMGAFIGRRRLVVLVAIGVMAAGSWGAGPASAVSRVNRRPSRRSLRVGCIRAHCRRVRQSSAGVTTPTASWGTTRLHGPWCRSRSTARDNAGVLRGVTAITAGNGFSCALLTAGTVDCWGYGGGDLGFGTTGRSLVPVPVHGIHNRGFLTGVTAISAGNGFGVRCSTPGTSTVGARMAKASWETSRPCGHWFPSRFTAFATVGC